MPAYNTHTTTVPNSTWERLTKLLSREVKRCSQECNGRWRLVLEQESDDIVQDFLLRKLGRPQWVLFIGQCKHLIERGSLPSVIRADLRSFVFRALKALHKEPALAGSALTDEVFELSFQAFPMRPEEAADRLLQASVDRYELSRVRTRSKGMKQIIKLGLRGWSYQQIASEIGVCEKTVRNRLRRLADRN